MAYLHSADHGDAASTRECGLGSHTQKCAPGPGFAAVPTNSEGVRMPAKTVDSERE